MARPHFPLIELTLLQMKAARDRGEIGPEPVKIEAIQRYAAEVIRGNVTKDGTDALANMLQGQFKRLDRAGFRLFLEALALAAYDHRQEKSRVRMRSPKKPPKRKRLNGATVQ